MKQKKGLYFARVATVLLMTGMIGSQIPGTSNVAFAQNIYVDPDDYIKKSDLEAAQIKQTVITLAGVGVISYLTTVIKAATAAAAAPAAAPAAATTAATAPAASPGNSGTPVSAEASTATVSVPETASTTASGGQ